VYPHAHTHAQANSQKHHACTHASAFILRHKLVCMGTRTNFASLHTVEGLMHDKTCTHASWHALVHVHSRASPNPGIRKTCTKTNKGAHTYITQWSTHTHTNTTPAHLSPCTHRSRAQEGYIQTRAATHKGAHAAQRTRARTHTHKPPNV